MCSASGLTITFGANCGSISTMSAPVALMLLDALADRRAVLIEPLIAQHRIGAELPQHQIGLLGDDRARRSAQHVGDFFAVDAAVEHGDRATGKLRLQVSTCSRLG